MPIKVLFYSNDVLRNLYRVKRVLEGCHDGPVSHSIIQSKYFIREY